jgi:hypothetical protein
MSIGRESLHFFYILGVVAYLQVSPLGGSRDETWLGQGERKRSVLEFAKFDICRVTNGGHIEHL